MKVTVDQLVCKGYANCIVEAPDVFDFDDDVGKAVVLVDEPDPAVLSEVEQAVRMCPVHAISTTD